MLMLKSRKPPSTIEIGDNKFNKNCKNNYKNTGLTGTDKGLTMVPAGTSVATIIAVITKNSTLVSAEALLDPGLSVTTEIAKGSYC